MAIKVLDTSTGAIFTFPITPSSITVKDGSKFIEYSLMDVGDAKIPRGSELTEVNFNGLLPGAARRRSAYIIEQVEPMDARTLWEVWKDEGIKLRLTIDGSTIDDAFYLNTFQTSQEGGFGDYSYEISFVRAVEIIIQTTVEESGSDRPESAQASSRTYTTKKNDTLYLIAKRFYGSGKKWTKIYDANKNTIKKSTTKLPGGLVLVIP